MELIVFLIISVVGGLCGLVVWMYYLKKGQFEDPEDPKYQIFRQEEEEDAKISK